MYTVWLQAWNYLMQEVVENFVKILDELWWELGRLQYIELYLIKYYNFACFSSYLYTNEGVWHVSLFFRSYSLTSTSYIPRANVYLGKRYRGNWLVLSSFIRSRNTFVHPQPTELHLCFKKFCSLSSSKILISSAPSLGTRFSVSLQHGIVHEWL